MSSSFETVKSTLIGALNGESTVVALSGKWGTGKSYLWKIVAPQVKGKDGKVGPIYVSLFGAKTTAELKMRIIQSAALKSDARYKEYVGAAGGFLKSLLGKYLPGAAIDDFVFLSIPTLVRDRLIVIDDVERKHKSLDIEEVMGLINEYSENHKTRFLLVLNSDKLSDQAMWETLHEKVIDTEIVLDPTPTEAFSTAVPSSPLSFVPAVRAAVEILNINNIRVIRRIFRVVTKLMDGRGTLDEKAISRVVPSTVLLTALHFRAIAAGPPMSYVTSYNSIANLFSKDTEQKPEEIEWNNILGRLGINSAGEYENIVCSYLKTGLIDTAKLNALIQSYKKSSAYNAIQQRLQEFFTTYSWDSSLDNKSLTGMASAFLPDVEFIEAPSISSLADVLEEIGNPELATQLIESWINKFDERMELKDISEDSFRSFHQKIHPRILEKFSLLKDAKYPPLSLEEAINRIVKNSGWGNREEATLSKSTIEQYEKTLRCLKKDDLSSFLHEHLSRLRNGGSVNHPAFTIATANFEAASRSICLAEPTSRLSNILRREFDRNGLSSKLLQRES